MTGESIGLGTLVWRERERCPRCGGRKSYTKSEMCARCRGVTRRRFARSIRIHHARRDGRLSMAQTAVLFGLSAGRIQQQCSKVERFNRGMLGRAERSIATLVRLMDESA